MRLLHHAVATYDRGNGGALIMRRALALFGLIGLGVLLGFAIRAVWPRPDEAPVYTPPRADLVSEERRSA